MSRSDESDSDIGDGEESATNSSSVYNSCTTNSYTNSASSNYSLNDKRHSRNQNEKKRRDQFNSLIIELGSLLNHTRKVDKSTILSETLFFIRNYNEKPLYSKEIDFKYKPFFLQNDDFMRFMIEFQNAFCLVFDMAGQIKYVSDHILHLLGHYSKNIQNCSLFDFIDEKSAKHVRNLLTKRSFSDKDPISFNCKFKKGSKQSNSYESIELNGFFKQKSNSSESYGYFNTIAKLDSFLEIDQLFPQDNNKREFTSEFSLDLKYISLDPKASEIIGYSPIEVLGNLVYDYCHHEDLDKLLDSHKKLLNDGAVPAVIYRYRTKGQQWIWLESRFELLTNGFNCKNCAILAHNKMIILNEMLDSHEILDSTTTTASKFFGESRESTPLNEAVEAISSDETAKDSSSSKISFDSNIEPFIDRKTATSSIHNQYEGESLNNETKLKSNNPKYSPSAILSDPNLSFVSTSSKKKSNTDIDDDLEMIFVKSFKDIRYRNFVLKQLRLKRTQIESVIRKQQEELKVLEATMENIMDEKKLENWHLEFQRQQTLVKQRNTQSNEQHPVAATRKIDQSSSSKTKATGINDDTAVMSSYEMENAIVKSGKHKKPIAGSVATASMLFKKAPRFNDNTSASSSKRIKLSAPQSQRQLQQPEVIESSTTLNDLVGDLITLQNMIPPSSNESEARNSNSSPPPPPLNIASLKSSSAAAVQRSNSSSNLNQFNFDMDDDINNEIIDKLFNQYSFDSFNQQ